MGFLDLIVGEAGKSLEQQGTNLVGPEQVYDLLVGQNRVGKRTPAAHCDDK